MDVLLQRARSFASEAAKKSQDLAKEAAKISQEIALETAKRSKELATEASKKADQLKALAGDITLPIPSSSSSNSSSSSSAAPSSSAPSSSSAASEEELIKYGITSELREFVNGLTLSTFQDFPLEGLDSDAKEEVGVSNVRKDLTEWQEQHALLVLKAVPEISQFRYDLCPRHMKEKRFWRIYFTLVRSHVVLYEAPPVVPEDFLGNQHSERATAAKASPNKEGKIVETPVKLVEMTEKKRAIDDQDLDAYLLGDSDGDGEDVGSDAEFDQLSTALDSDAEEDERHESKVASSSTKASGGSSDGELV